MSQKPRAVQLEAAADRLVLGGVSDGHPLQRYLRAATAKQLGLGSYKSAWLLCAKLRAAWWPATAGRWPGWSRSTKPRSSAAARTIRRPAGKGAAIRARCSWSAPSRWRRRGRPRPRPPPTMSDYSAESLHAFIKANVAAGATAKTDGWAGYSGAPGVTHDPHVVGRWPPMSSCPGPIVSSPTSRAGRSASITGCAKTPAILPRRVRLPLQSPPRQTRRLPLAARRRASHQPLTYKMLIQPEAQA